jgi:DNA-binding transcriptional LysR family regulator
MELRHLKTFRKVAQVLNVTRAAIELNYAQSSVTSQIKTLEADLNVSLFERVGRQIRLTEAGQRLLPYADRILDLAEETQRTIIDGDEPVGGLAVGSIESITSYRMPALLEMFHHRYPDVRLSLRSTPCGEITDALRQGMIDVGFLMDEKTDHQGLMSVLLCDEELIVVAAPDDPLTFRDTATLGDLRTAKVIAVEPGCAYRDLFELELRKGSFASPAVLEFGTIEAIKRSVMSGFGISLLPKVTVQKELSSCALAIVPWEVPFRVSTQLAWHQDKWMSQRLKIFIDETIKSFCE